MGNSAGSPGSPPTECAICSGPLHDPRTLCCGHTFCKACLVKQVSFVGENHPRDVKCAICRQKTPIPPSEIPSNFRARSPSEQSFSGAEGGDSAYESQNPLTGNIPSSARSSGTGKNTRRKTAEEQEIEDLRSGKLIQVFVKTVTGKVITLKVRPCELITIFKQMIAELENITPENQRLVYNGRVMEDGRTLSHYDVRNDATINLVMRLVGGYT